MNTITLYGRLGKDAEKKILTSGQSVLNLVLATNTQKAGVKETIWWRVSVWGDRFKSMEPYLKKGSALMVTGNMHYPRIYQDTSGTNQLSLDVTAYNIKFSPFGGLAEEETKTVQSSIDSPESLGRPQQGQNEADLSEVFDEKHAFKEDEMPF